MKKNNPYNSAISQLDKLMNETIKQNIHKFYDCNIDLDGFTVKRIFNEQVGVCLEIQKYKIIMGNTKIPEGNLKKIKINELNILQKNTILNSL